MIDFLTRFVLPLMHHLVQQRVASLFPSIAANVAPAERGLGWLAVRGAGVVPEAAAHSA
jgi:hypothetical protein